MMILTNFAFLYTSIHERPELTLSSHGRKVHSLGRPVPAIEGLVAGTGLSPLIVCSVDIGDRGLLSSFVERWHRETSSFHLPMGELTITLDDISSLLHLPVVGDLHAFQPLHVDDAIQMLVDLLMVYAEAVKAETGQCRGLYVRLQWYVISTSADARQVIGQLRLAHIFFIFWVALCLLTRVKPMCMLCI